MSNKEYIWTHLLADIGNEFGVAGLMGNLQAESGLYPDRVQGDIPYSSYSQEYTAKVDSGEISEYDFVHNGPNGSGYGLAQWTYYARKQALYNMYKSGGYSSIGSVELAVDYLLYELKNDFSGVYSTLKNATSIREASDKVLHDFENPADQSESVEVKRCELGTSIYNELTEYSKNKEIIEKAIEWAVGIANDDTHGYDQNNRWGPDYDCSSLLIQAFENAGCPVKTNGATYTGNMESVFIKTGFERIEYTSNDNLIRGDVLLRDGHTAMYIGDGKIVSAHINELGTTTGGTTGDQTSNEIDVSTYISTNWELVLRLPATTSGGSDDNDEPDSPTYLSYRKKNNYKFILFKKKGSMI